MTAIPVSQKIDAFFHQFPQNNFKKDEVILTPGTQPTGLFFLQKGIVRQFVNTLDGSELTMHFFKEGSFFPLFWAINNLTNRYDYKAFTGIETRIVPKDKFLEFLKNDPEILFSLTGRLLFGLDGLLTRVESLASRDARQRTIGIILFLTKHFGSQNGNSLTLTCPFTHSDIANLTGLTRETTSRQLKNLSKEGLIAVKNRLISIPSPNLLK